MPSIGILAPDDASRRDLVLIAGESGYLAHPVAGLPEALELIRERRPGLMLVADGPGGDAEVLARELAAAAPLVPVVVALKKRDAARAVSLMRQGVAEVVAPPWTREDVAACLGRTLRGRGAVFSAVETGRPLPALPIFLFLLAVFFGIAVGFVALRRQAALRASALEEKSSWDLPYGHTAAASFHGPELWILDWFTQSIYVHSKDDVAVRRVERFPGELPVSFSIGPDALWAAYPSGRVARRMADERLRLLAEYPGAAPGVVALVYDGLYLWTADAKTRTLRKHLNDEKLTVLGSWRYAGARPAALVFDGKALWSLDSQGRELLCHNLERPDEVVRRVPLDEYRDGLHLPVGLAWDGERFWTVGDSVPPGKAPARLFKHSLSSR